MSRPEKQPAKSLARIRLVCGVQWAAFFFVVGLIAASWTEALLYGAGGGFVLGCALRMGIFEFLWYVVTLRKWQIWRQPHWRDRL